ncbi:MAG TPA: MGMT family protein [Candidatus Saccharimonadales bacterium]|nr:MGMT family protein [Candidatus Saccharimonadales bacterium]
MQSRHDKSNLIRNSNAIKSTINSDDVYEILLNIPVGMVSTYGDLAKALGNPAASRQVGKILSKNPNPIVVPCHRVVKADGKLGGYAFGTSKKKKLLEDEGILFAKDLKIGQFNKIRYYPQNKSKSSNPYT